MLISKNKLKLFYTFLTIIACSSYAYGQQFQLTIGGPSSDTAYSIIQNSTGGYTIAGVTGSFGAGGVDFYIVELDHNGNLQWNKTVGGSGDDMAFSIIQTLDGGYAIAGETNSFGAGSYDFYIVKLSNIGNLQWSRTIGGTNYDYAWSIVQTPDRGFAIAGSTNSFGAGSDDIYLVKLDSNGNLLWSRTVGGMNQDNAFYSIIYTADGGYIISGRSNSFGAGSYDMFIVKLDGAGMLQWSKTLGGVNDDHVSKIIQTKDGGYAVAGGTTSFGAGNYDFYVAKLDSIGTLRWVRTIGGTLSERAYSIIQTADSNYAVAGWTNSFGNGGYDIFIVKLDGGGNLIWSRTVGAVNDDYARSITQTADGGLAVAGITSSFGAGNYDFFVVKLDQNANTCQNTNLVSSISGTGSIFGNTVPSVTFPPSVVHSPGSITGLGGTLTNICFIGIKIISTKTPESYELYNNYPNPFNPNTLIRFDIAKTTFTNLTIYDILGREVLKPVNEKLNPGKYEINFDGTNYPSGVYFYRLVTEYYTDTKKMVLMK